MRLLSGTIAICSLLALPTAAAAQLSPTGPWVVSHEGGVCLLQRSYGTPAQPFAVGFRQVPTIEGVRMFVVDSGSGPVRARTVRIGTGSGQVVKSELVSYLTGDGGKRASETAASRALVASAAATGTLTVDAGSELRHTISVPGMTSALAELDACVAEKLAEWGVAREQQLATSRFPQPDKDALPDPRRDYIETLSVSGVLDNLAYVRVDAAGRASGCKLLLSSGNRDVDQASCDVLLAARFKPAVDRAGRPLASVYAHSFRWNASDYR